MCKGIILVISTTDMYKVISSYLNDIVEYQSINCDLKQGISIIKDETKPNVVACVFEKSCLNDDELAILAKGNFQKLAIFGDIQEYYAIKNIISLNKIFLLPMIKEDFVLSINEAIKQYITLQACKKQKKELDYLKSHNDKIQKFLIDSEKMITLGQQFAGVVHEINTPFGAIKSSSENMKVSLHRVLEKLPKLFEMIDDESVKILFFRLLERSANETTTLTTREERTLKKGLTAELESIGIINVREVANQFAKVRLYKDIIEYIPLVKSQYADLIFETAYQMVDLQSSTDNISIGVDKATKMIKALKSYARYDNTNDMVKANIKDSLETVLTIYHNQIKQNTELIREYDEIEDIYCYIDELNQVWTNLIHNALQAMEYQGMLTIGIKDDKLYQIVSVKDSGCGIPDDIKDKIFNAFFTTKPAGVGTGLGLDILKKIIDKHNGKVEFSSTVGVGTEFRVYIPKITEK